MQTRRRFVAATAIAAAAALFGALGAGLTSASAAPAAEPGAGVTFTSTPAVSQLVAHYTVTPADRHAATSTGSASAADSRELPDLSKQGDPVFRAASDLASAPASDTTSADQATPQAQAAGAVAARASFIGQQSSATTCHYFLVGCNPPDMAVAASPRFVFQGVNTQWEVLDTAGHVQAGWPVSAQTFFGAPNETNNGAPCDVAHLSQPFQSDPRALYDPVSGRFFAAMLQAENALGIAPDCPFKSVYYIAVSQTSDPRGAWNVYVFNMSLDGQFAADFTQIGVNRDGVFFSANMFGPATGLNGGFYAEIFEANKAQMERGQANFTADGFFNLQAHGPGTTAATGPFIADTVQPAMSIDGSGGSAGIFADTFDGPDPVTGHFCGLFGGGAADACSGLAIWRMNNPIGHDFGGAAPVLTASVAPTKPFVFPPPADQPSCSRCVDASDLRISGTPMLRDGVLYAGFETALNNGTQVVPAVEFAQVRTGDPDSTRSGYFSLSGDAAASFPVLLPDEHGNVVMLYDRMSSAVFPETRFIVKRANGDFEGIGTLLKAGEGSYRPQLCGTGTPPTVCRWGDFSAITFDGRDRIWFAGQYANTLQLGPPQNGRNWGTWIGAVSAS
jgi:hypothetical protein